MPAFMVGTSPELYEAESTVLKGHAAMPIDPRNAGPRTLSESFRLNKHSEKILRRRNIGLKLVHNLCG
jgi:hypothetical protein